MAAVHGLRAALLGGLRHISKALLHTDPAAIPVERQDWDDALSIQTDLTHEAMISQADCPRFNGTELLTKQTVIVAFCDKSLAVKAKAISLQSSMFIDAVPVTPPVSEQASGRRIKPLSLGRLHVTITPGKTLDLEPLYRNLRQLTDFLDWPMPILGRVRAPLIPIADGKDYPLCRQVTLIDPSVVDVTILPVDRFLVDIESLSLACEVSNPRFDKGKQAQHSQSPLRLAPVKLLPPPPQTKRPNLIDRLRSILTPPINELLSDPALYLPYKPHDFQTSGIQWLRERNSALLADEMGLGKTMQAILAARLLYRDGVINQILIVCPKPLLANWMKELKLWWPTLQDHNIITSAKEKDRHWLLQLGTSHAIVKIINYEALQMEKDWLVLQKFSHDLIIIDEAQRIKNPESKTAQAVKALRASRRWAITGTPLENRIEDFVSIFNFIHPGYMQQATPAYVAERKVPFFLRRRCDDEEMTLQLPEKVEQDIEIELTPAQRKTYDKAENEGIMELNAHGDSVSITHVFALISKLRQVCNFDSVTGDSAKLDYLLDDLEEICDSGRKALIFSQLVGDQFGLKRLQRKLSEWAYFRTKGFKVVELHGDIRQDRRTQNQEQFKNSADTPVMLLNYAIGGVGLNLQSANYVYLFDRWWNPAVEDQAIKRAHRIGQTSKVFVRRFVCKDTIEQRMVHKIRLKRRLFQNVIDEGREVESMGLSTEELFGLFNLRVRPSKGSKTPVVPKVALDSMDSQQFCDLVGMIYEKDGYQVRHLDNEPQLGPVLIAERGGTVKDRIIIWCCLQDDTVDIELIETFRQLISGRRGAIVTRGTFPRRRGRSIEADGLDLIDKHKLKALAEHHKIARLESAPDDK